MLTSIDVPEDLMQEIDALVEQRKASKSKVREQPYQTNDAEKMHAKLLAQTQGAEAANAFLKSLQPVAPPASRGAVLCDLIRVALCMVPPESFGQPVVPATRMAPLRPSVVHKIRK